MNTKKLHEAVDSLEKVAKILEPNQDWFGSGFGMPRVTFSAKIEKVTKEQYHQIRKLGWKITDLGWEYDP